MLVGFLIIQYVFLLPPDFSNGVGQTTFVIDLSVSVLMPVAIGVGLGYLVALIPLKKSISYKQRTKISLPLMVSVVGIFFCSIFGYSAYLKIVDGVAFSPLIKYDNIRIPANLDCSSVHDGIFETENLLIERLGDKQYQTNKTTGERNEYIVEWINDCEYILTSTLDHSNKLKVKITAVNPNNYGCHVISDKQHHPYPKFMIINRVSEKERNQ